MIDADNIGFITPASFVKIIIENLLQQNEPHFAGIGGKLQKNADNFNPLLKQSTAKGVIVDRILPGGFLEAASIRKRDVILSLNGVAFDRHGIVIGKEGHFRHKNIYDVMKLVPIGDNAEVVYLRNGECRRANAIAMRNPEKGVRSNPIIEEREYLEVFGMIVQQLSVEIIEAMRNIDSYAQIDMLQTIEQQEPVLVVTHIHQGTQADEMEWSVGEMIVTANDEQIHTLGELKNVIDKNANGSVLLECRSGMIGYFQVE
jgi:S1-C subfamily serine protease